LSVDLAYRDSVGEHNPAGQGELGTSGDSSSENQLDNYVDKTKKITVTRDSADVTTHTEI
jgi:hypothetical protein